MKQWEEFLERQVKELGEVIVRKWLFPLRILKYDAQNLFLEASDSFHLLWFEEHIRSKVERELFNNNGKKIKVTLSVKGSPLQQKKMPKSDEEKKRPFSLIFDPIDPLLTFENFIERPEHRIVFQGLKKPSFNPLYLFGEKGSGKTHLLQATAQEMRKNGLQVIYAQGETFTSHVVSAIRCSEMTLFRQAYRRADVLIIDDVDAFAHKGATQEELFHTFNELHLSQKPIILSSQKPPHELTFIEPRLISRFEWGLSLPLASPTPDQLGEILERKCQLLRFPLHNKVKEFLMTEFGRNGSLLLQALITLYLRTDKMPGRTQSGKSFPSTTMTVPLAKHHLHDLLEKAETEKLTPKKIIQFVAEHENVKAEDILGASQSREISNPRKIAMALCRYELKLPYKKIGELFERDHSTVMSSIKAIEQKINLNDLAKKILSK